MGRLGTLRYRCRPGSPASPLRRITSSTVQRATCRPRPCTSSAWMRLAPEVRREAWWISAMTLSSNPWRTERADGSRRRQQ